MDRNQISDALDGLNEAYVAEAASYRAARRRRLWPLAAAACAALCLGLYAFTQTSGGPVAQDTEPVTWYSQAEILEIEPFGRYYPTQIPDGYVLEGDGIGLFGDDRTVLSASYVSTADGDTLTIQIAPKDRFQPEAWNTALCTRTTSGEAWRVYLDVGDWAVCYRTGRDPAQLPGFEDMVRSAAYFSGPEPGRYRMTVQGNPDTALLPELELQEDGTFTFWYDMLSSYLSYGTYQVSDGVLTADTSDGRCHYEFRIVDHRTVAFDAARSSELHLIQPDLGVEVPDGAVFCLEQK